MTKKILVLGAPSLTGKDANDVIAQTFAKATFPLSVTVTNLMPFPTVFPEVKCSLRGITVSDGSNVQTVVVQNMDRFQRFASSLEQVAECNRIAEAIQIEAEAPDEDAAPAAAAAAAATDATATTAKKSAKK